MRQKRRAEPFPFGGGVTLQVGNSSEKRLGDYRVPFCDLFHAYNLPLLYRIGEYSIYGNDYDDGSGSEVSLSSCRRGSLVTEKLPGWR